MINLINLAKSGDEQAKTVPKTPLYVQLLKTNQAKTIETSLWLTLLEGELLIDLPHGDFKHLRVGDSVVLTAMDIQFTPVEDSVILWQEI